MASMMCRHLGAKVVQPSPFTDVSPEQWQQLIERRRKEAFLAACRWPVSWISPASRHKNAAEVLYKVACAAQRRIIERLLAESKPETGSTCRELQGEELSDHLESDLIADYFVLAGYAIECVLKGYLL